MADDSGTISNPNVGSPADRATGAKKKDRGGLQGGLRAAGASLQASGQDEMDRASSERITPVAYRKGGKVRKAKHRVKPRA